MSLLGSIWGSEGLAQCSPTMSLLIADVEDVPSLCMGALCNRRGWLGKLLLGFVNSSHALGVVYGAAGMVQIAKTIRYVGHCQWHNLGHD